VLKRLAGALYDWMWGPHDRDTVWERSDQVMEQVWSCFCDCIYVYMCIYMWFLLNEYAISVDGA
jgi:hypothetical protein